VAAIVITILLDQNIKGTAALIRGTIAAQGWLDLLELRVATFDDVGLTEETDDRTIWRFVQEHQVLLLTDNRNGAGANSLERTMREEWTDISLPVLTIGDSERIGEADYRARCVARLIEIIFELDNLRGATRLFIP
jgi:hypothetical protein